MIAAGLYRSTEALDESEGRVVGPKLVWLCIEDGQVEVRLPEHHIHNQWRFPPPGIVLQDQEWLKTLTKLPREGFYALKKKLVFDGGFWPKGALVQLGYTREAEAVLFIAQRRSQRDENDLFFSEQGVPLPLEQLSDLEPLVVAAEPIQEDR